ncbi:hypothetical protein GALL_414870 [mine drainage metagenome]|uniref:Uncharacterized protein n=1 Tax=mine drainage metagenome TaxID=410659 RepID=A0A1J5QA02_9ZZZZ
MRFQRHAGIHQAQTATAHRSHARRTIGFSHLRHHTHGVWKVFFGRQYGNQRALCQTTMANFTAFGGANASGFTGRKGRHVVVQHEAVFIVARQRINALRIAFGSQRGYHQRLGFTPGEQSRAMGARQHAVADFDSTYGARVTAINAWFTRQNLSTDQLRFNLKQQTFNSHAIKCSTFCFQSRHHIGISRTASLRAGLLVANLVGCRQLVMGQSIHLGDQGLVLGRRCPVPRRFAGITHQIMDGIDRNRALGVAKHHRPKHNFFRQLVGFRFHHQHSRFGARHHQIHLARFALSLAWI